MISKLLVFTFFFISFIDLNAQREYRLLKNAYKDDSTEKMIDFLLKWKEDNSRSDKISSNSGRGKLIAIADFLANDYYNQNYKNDFSEQRVVLPDKINCRFFFTPDKIIEDINKFQSNQISKQKVTDSFGRFWISAGASDYYDSILILSDFLSFDDVLFLTQKYSDVINKFLGDKGKIEVGGLFVHKTNSQTKYNFLVKYIPLFPGHWGGWHIGTFPLIENIFVDSDLNWLIISARTDYDIQDILYIQIDNKWMPIDVILTMTE